MTARKSQNKLLLVGAILILTAAIAFFAYKQQILFEKMQEDVAYLFNSTPERAFAYGEKHFNALTPDEYDVDRAESFYKDAAKSDPNLPLVHFELARIAFLRSDFITALNLINQEFVVNNDPAPQIYYVRALIEGYMGNYHDAEADYETYFKKFPANWAVINDYSWILLKDNRPAEAQYALSWGLKSWPQNAWLLANDATALYEMGTYAAAAAIAKKAIPAVNALTVADWLVAYPGNDPRIAQTGLANFKQTTQQNLSKILAKAK